MTTETTYRVTVNGKPVSDHLMTLAEVEKFVAGCSLLLTPYKIALMTGLRNFGWALNGPVEVTEDPYICRRCKVAVAAKDEEECAACLAKPRCKNCSDLAEPGSPVCKDCGARCDECRGRFKGEEETVLLETKNDAFYYHVRCCGPAAMKIAMNEYEPATLRAAAVGAIARWIAPANAMVTAAINAEE